MLFAYLFAKLLRQGDSEVTFVVINFSFNRVLTFIAVFIFLSCFLFSFIFCFIVLTCIFLFFLLFSFIFFIYLFIYSFFIYLFFSHVFQNFIFISAIRFRYEKKMIFLAKFLTIHSFLLTTKLKHFKEERIYVLCQ